MNTGSLGRAASRPEMLDPVRLLSTFWGLAVVVALGIYSVLQAVNPAPGALPARPAASRQEHTAAAFASFVPPASYPPIEREPPVLYLACGADDATQARLHDPPAPGRYPVVMRLDQVPDDIRALLDGTDTAFPKDATINETPCIHGMLDRGELP